MCSLAICSLACCVPISMTLSPSLSPDMFISYSARYPPLSVFILSFCVSNSLCLCPSLSFPLLCALMWVSFRSFILRVYSTTYYSLSFNSFILDTYIESPKETTTQRFQLLLLLLLPCIATDIWLSVCFVYRL